MQIFTGFLVMWAPLVAGQYTLSGSESYGTVGESFTFTCITSPVTTDIEWCGAYTNDRPYGWCVEYSYMGDQCVQRGGTAYELIYTCNSSGVFTLTLSVWYAKHKDSEWWCRKPRKEGTMTFSNHIFLDVRVPLTRVTLLYTASSALTVTQGDAVSLVCETNPTDPVSVIIWRKGSQTITLDVTPSRRSGKYGIVTVSVWSKSVQWGDRGNYSCQATNNGTFLTSQTLSLTVKVSTVPVSSVTLTKITDNQQISLIENSTLVLSCRTSDSYPAPTVTWYINDYLISSGVVSKTETHASGQVVTVSSITRTVRRDNDRDQIYCRAENGFGDKQSLTARAKVYSAPPMPEDLIVLGTGLHTIKLSWKVTPLSGINQAFLVECKDDGFDWNMLKDLYNETGEMYMQAYVTDLKPGTLYFLRVKALTSIGSSNFTEDLRAFTKHSLETNEITQEMNNQEINTGQILSGIGIAMIILAVVFATIVIFIVFIHKRSMNKGKEEHYASLQSRRGNTYDEIQRPTVYQTTEFNTDERSETNAEA